MPNQQRPRSSYIAGSDVSQGDLREHQPAYTPSPQRDLEELYKKHAQEVWARAYALLSNAADAEDVRTEVFLRLIKEYMKGNPILNPRAWLMRVCANLVKDRRRSVGQRRQSKEFDPEDLDNIESNVVSPLEFLCRGEQNTALKDALAELPIELRTLLVLRFFESMKINEISKETGVPSTTVYRNINRALHLLKERLASRYENNRPGLACAS